MLKINKNNLDALSLKIKALMVLEKNREALKYIKKSLAIKYNKTLYKYLVEIENKSKSTNNFSLKNELLRIEKCKFDVEKNNREEYKKIFEPSSHSSLFYENKFFKDSNENLRNEENKNYQGFNSCSDGSFYKKNQIIKKENSYNEKEVEDNDSRNKKNNSLNILDTLNKFLQIVLKIMLEKLKTHKSLIIFFVVFFGFMNKNKLLRKLKLILYFTKLL